ncbi:MAG: prepilin-type N-terminal cleavage/methylation domain-containing protein [Patescibacteria group bacterium]|nr:prepilin-type N-terminal cleavage/methylation domain-containing protein [Patescibacteria group bacterium]
MQKGFSLVEILVAIAIIGILASAGFLLGSRLSSDLQLSSAANDVANELRYAQQKAIAEQVDYGVSFDSSGNSYVLVKDYTEQITGKTLPKFVSFGEISLPEQQAVFNGYGAAKSFGSVVLTARDKTKTVEIKSSGFIKIK